MTEELNLIEIKNYLNDYKLYRLKRSLERLTVFYKQNAPMIMKKVELELIKSIGDSMLIEL